MIAKLWNTIKNMIGDMKGSWRCLGCNNSLEYMDVFSFPVIAYDDTIGRGMRPLCPECFKRLSLTEILEHCRALVHLWNKYGSLTEWVDIRDKVRESIETIKNSDEGIQVSQHDIPY